MKFEIKKFKKIHADPDITVLQHEDGHEIKIAHKHISPKMRGEIEALPMADGGDVEEFQSSVRKAFNYKDKPEQAIPTRQGDELKIPSNQAGSERADDLIKSFPSTLEELHKQQNMADGGSVIDAQSLGSHGDEMVDIPGGQIPGAGNMPVPTMADSLGMQQASAPIQQAVQQAPQQNPAQQDPYGTEQYYKGMAQGIGEQHQGIETQQGAEQQQAQESQDIAQHSANYLNYVQALHNRYLDNYHTERQKLMQEANQGHIDPNKFWEDKSTLGKVGTLIGMVMGGIGGGLTGQENPALKMFNAQVDRNIQAQKMNLENKFSLLNANRQQFQDENDATNMTRIMLNDQISNQLKLAAAKAQDPMAKARALTAAGQLDMQSAPIMSQIALRRSMLSANPNIDPTTKIRFSPFLQEGEKTAALKEYGESQQYSKTMDNLLASFDKAAKLNTLSNNVSSPFQTPEKVSALVKPLIAQLSKDTAGRFTEQDAGMVSSLFPKAKDDQKTLALKRQQLMKLFQQKGNFPMLQSIGISPLSSGSRFNQQGQSKIKEFAPINSQGK